MRTCGSLPFQHGIKDYRITGSWPCRCFSVAMDRSMADGSRQGTASWCRTSSGRMRRSSSSLLRQAMLFGGVVPPILATMWDVDRPGSRSISATVPPDANTSDAPTTWSGV